jgi:hypothetical protein
MNLLHRLVCRSALWRWTVERWVIPWALDGVDPGEDVLELGPGPGLTTDVLRERAARLTAALGTQAVGEWVIFPEFVG